MTRKDLIVVPDADKTFAGALTYWRLSGEVMAAKLQDAFEHRGIPEELLPPPSDPCKALHKAVIAQRRPRRLIRPLERRGAWAIVDEDINRLAWEATTTVKINAIGRPEIVPSGTSLADEVRRAQEHYLTVLTQGAISAWLIHNVHRLLAVNLRDTGGIYFVPPEKVSEWEDLTEALEDASECSVYTIPAMKTDKAVRAVLDGITFEAETKAEKMAAEIPKLGKRGLTSKLQDCESMEEKIEYYEALLGQKLEKLRGSLDSLKASIAAGILVRENEDNPDQVAVGQD